MRRMITFEFRKIFTRRIPVLGMGILLLFNLLFLSSVWRSMYATDGREAEATGMQAITLDKRIAEKYEGVLTDKKVKQMLEDFRPTTDLHGMNAAYLYQNSTQSAAYARFSDIDGNWNGLTVRDVYGDEKIQIGYVYGWLSVSQELVRIFFMLMLLEILMVAPVFSGEYGGADSLILTTRYGKTRGTAAKVAAAFLAAFLLTLFFVVFDLTAAFAVFGSEGLDCSIRFAPSEFTEYYIPFNLTCGQLLGYQILLIFTCTFAVTGMTLFVSAACRSQIAALAVSLAVFAAPMICNISEGDPLYRMIVLTPVYQVQFISLMSMDQMKNGLLYAVWALPEAFVLAAVGGGCSRKIFAGHQVS